MRQRYPIQQSLGTTPISEVSIYTKSRHELPPILQALQYLFLQEELREEVLSIVEAAVMKGKQATGRPGMDLWEILVMGVVRLGLDANYDELEDLGNNHKSFRGILGVDVASGFGQGKEYKLQTLKDNVSLLDEESICQINTLVVKAGHELVKKKEEGLRVKADSYVLETRVHFPTDVNLLYDSGRKCLDMIAKASKQQGSPLKGWRKVMDWHKRLRKAERRLTTILSRGGKNRATRLETATEDYLAIARRITEKIDSSASELAGATGARMLAILMALEHYQQLLEKHIDLVRRRLLEGETIPHADKLFSIFEQHTQWINKGKKHKKCELGHNVLIATDQFHFILYHLVMETEHDVDLALPVAQEICQTYQQDQLDSLSFDRGFYSLPNYENLQPYAQIVVLPKKGNLSQQEQERESDKTFVALRHQHSAVEANINQLEHHGLNQCPDKGIRAFKRYAALGVLAYNLHRLGKILIAQQKESAPPVKKAA